MARSGRPSLTPVKGAVPRYALAVLLAAVATGVRLVVHNMLPPGFPFLTFFPAVILASFLCGRGPGLLCGVLGGLAAWQLFIVTPGTFRFDAQVATALAFYAFVVVVDVLLIAALMTRQRLLVEREAELSRMADNQTLLFKELQHRVANNLASVSAMLRLQGRAIARDPASAGEAIGRAVQRIELMGQVHRLLYDPASASLPAGDHLARVVEQVKNVAGAADVAVTVEADPVRLPLDRLMSVVLLLAELLTNCFKHAFGDRPADAAAPHVTIALRRISPALLRLSVSDNGRGITPCTPAPGGASGLGTAIVQGFVVQLGGTLTTRSADGVTTEVDFPADAD